MDILLLLIGLGMVIVFGIKMIFGKKEKRKASAAKAGIGFVLFIVGIMIMPEGEVEEEAQTDPQEEIVVEEEAEPEPEVVEEETPEVEEEPAEPEEELTTAQRNAIRQAENYIRTMPFSHSGLIEQLEFEGYSKEDATLAVNSIEVDWKEQAVRSAENYLNSMPFSRDGLIEQLMFEGYSREEATHGVDAVGL